MFRVRSFLNPSSNFYLFSNNLRSSALVASDLEKIDQGNEKQTNFRRCFVIPDRKLTAQLILERMTGRATDKIGFKRDFFNRLNRRNPRTEEMDVNQDWQSVWPGAQSFRAHTVPLPIRMGTTSNLSRRPPPKKVGNLELVKIPNFLHLTPKAVERHCAAIKKFCTEFPKELKENESLASKAFPLNVEYSDYVHQGPSLRDPRAKKVTHKIFLKSLNLSDHGKEKMMRLVGKRYDEKTDVLTLETDRCYTRKQNRDYGVYLLAVLLSEAEKIEPWEKLKSSKDDMRIKFEDFKLIE